MLKQEQEAFVWQKHKGAEEYLKGHLHYFCEMNGFLETLRQRMERETSTSLFAWLDHLGIAYSEEEERMLLGLGFKHQGSFVYAHPGAQLPRVVLHDQERFRLHGVAMKVDSIADFLMVRGLSCHIEGSFYGRYRRAAVAMENGVGLWVEERRGSRSMEPTWETAEELEQYHLAAESWKTRPRRWADQADCLNHSIELAQEMVELVGPHVAAYLVCEAERAYWESRNGAAQVQKGRQERLGLGWGNCDCHAFRSSRRLFPELVSLFEILGFTCREKLYAEGGWGVQIMENSHAGLVLSLEVDLMPEEVALDFAHQTLPDLPRLGIVGLWCALHGDSILEAGMHSLEAQFDFDRIGEDLRPLGVGMISPSSQFESLRQAFTIGELWPVKTHRLRYLLDRGLISEEEADLFFQEGALGSHLAIAERYEGYKGISPSLGARGSNGCVSGKSAVC